MDIANRRRLKTLKAVEDSFFSVHNSVKKILQTITRYRRTIAEEKVHRTKYSLQSESDYFKSVLPWTAESPYADIMLQDASAESS